MYFTFVMKNRAYSFCLKVHYLVKYFIGNAIERNLKCKQKRILQYHKMRNKATTTYCRVQLVQHVIYSTQLSQIPLAKA